MGTVTTETANADRKSDRRVSRNRAMADFVSSEGAKFDHRGEPNDCTPIRRIFFTG